MFSRQSWVPKLNSTYISWRGKGEDLSRGGVRRAEPYLNFPWGLKPPRGPHLLSIKGIVDLFQKTLPCLPEPKTLDRISLWKPVLKPGLGSFVDIIFSLWNVILFSFFIFSISQIKISWDLKKKTHLNFGLRIYLIYISLKYKVCIVHNPLLYYTLFYRKSYKI